MRKNDLIKLLQELEGNPEIALWNGFVEDYMSIDSLIESEVTKKTYNFYIDTVETQEKVKRLDWNYSLNSDDLEGLSKTYKECVGWEFNHYVTDEDIIEKRYSKKRIVLIQAKERGKASFDRAGLISY